MMIKRDFYIDRLKDRMWDGNIKVITGIRRCGKSTILFSLFKDYLLSTGVDSSNIIEIKLDQIKYYMFRDPIYLCNYVENIITSNKDKKYYLFIDEVQFTTKVKKKITTSETSNNNTTTSSYTEITLYDILNELKDHSNLDCYVTGSNSTMLSSDILTQFRGRSYQIHVFPLSFEEFYNFKMESEGYLIRGNSNTSLPDSFIRVYEETLIKEYMTFGGLPKVMYEQTPIDKKKYLSSLFDEIYIKDIVERSKIKKTDVLKNLLNFLASNVGSLTNINKIENTINSNINIKTNIPADKINSNLIRRYMDTISDAFIIYEAKRYDIKGRRHFLYPSKYYFVDTGLRNARLEFRQRDTGFLMENIIYIELIRRGYSVDVGAYAVRTSSSYKTKEVDFVVNSVEGRRIYIQSCYTLDDNVYHDYYDDNDNYNDGSGSGTTTTTTSNTSNISDSNIRRYEREVESLKIPDDYFKKIVIRNDIYESYYDEDGIFHCRLIDFLLNKVNLF